MKLIDKIKNNVEIRKKLKTQGKSRFTESMSHTIDGISYTASRERILK